MTTKTNGTNGNETPKASQHKATVREAGKRDYRVRWLGRDVWQTKNKYDAGVAARFLTESQYGATGK